MGAQETSTSLPVPIALTKPSPTIFLLSLIRNQLELSTWLLIGASIHCLLLFLPVKTTYIQFLPLVFLSIKIASHLLMAAGITRNTYMDGIIQQRMTAIPPNGPENSPNKSTDGKATILLLGVRVNHPLGVFAPGAKDIGNYFQKMDADLKANRATNGYLGSSTYLDAAARSSGSTIISNFYFRSAADSHAFAHGPVHREGWDWWNKFVKTHKHLAIMHEVYEAPAGRWENIYVNYEPMGFGATEVKVLEDDGSEAWRSPLVEAKGKYGTHKLRLGLDDE